MGLKERAKTLRTPEEIIDIINLNVRELCKLHGISLNQLADEVGVSHSYFVRSRSDMPITKLVAIADAFGVNPDRLYDDAYTAEIRRMAIDAQIERLKEAKRMLEES